MILLTSWVWFGNIQRHGSEEQWHHLWWEVIWCDKRRVIFLKHSILYFSFKKISTTRLDVPVVGLISNCAATSEGMTRIRQLDCHRPRPTQTGPLITIANQSLHFRQRRLLADVAT